MTKMGASLEAARLAKKRLEEQLKPLTSAMGLERLDDGGYQIEINLQAPLDAGQHVPNDVDGVLVRTEIVGPVTKR